MKIKGRSSYKAGPKDECATPIYGIVPLIGYIEAYRKLLSMKREDFIILEPATGMNGKSHTGIVDGFSTLGYTVIGLSDYDFEMIDMSFLENECSSLGEIKLIVTNPPFSVRLKKVFIRKCQHFYVDHGIPYALLMNTTTLSEKRNGEILEGCSVHIPFGRINYGMPNKGWGTRQNPTKATFDTAWFCKGLAKPNTIYRNFFNMSNHFDALDAFTQNTEIFKNVV